MADQSAMRRLLPSVLVAIALGIPALVLQRWIAETRFAAILLVLAWFAIVGVAVAIYILRRGDRRLVVGATYLAIIVGTLAIGYWTGFRDMVVDQDVAMAAARPSGGERLRALRGGSEPMPTPRSRRPVEIARGSFTGADGHAGSGTATVIDRPGEGRVLTFTRFDVDPGVDVDVFLSASPEDVSDRIELGDLAGNVGDQQYEIPAAADLRRYSNVILWCNPFTVRIAVADLGV
jgi:hypothetical protein